MATASKPAMKHSFSLLILCLLLMASCTGPEHKEKKFMADMQSEDVEKATQAFNDFCMWLQSDKSTMDYDFPLMREQMALKAVTSPDGKFRAISWITGVNEGIPSYANVLQWKHGDDFVGFCGPVDALIAGRKASVAKRANSPHRLDTIFEIDGGNFPVYLLVQSLNSEEGKCRAYTSAMFLNGISLQLLPNFFDGNEIAGNNDYVNDGSINAATLFKYDEKTRMYYAYQTDDNDNIVPGKYTVFKLEGDRYVHVDTPDSTDNNQ